MNYKNNLIIATIAIFFIVSGFLFLAFHHKDTLISNIPGEATAYFHTNSANFIKISEPKQALLLNYLENNSNLNRDSWQTIFTGTNDEFALFSIKRQIFGVIKNNSNNKQLLSINNISYQDSNDALIFPKVSVTDTKITDQDWFKQIHNKATFADATLTTKDTLLLNTNFTELPSNSPIFAKMSLIDDYINIKVNGEIGQEKTKTVSTDNIPQDTILFISGLNLSKLEQKTDYTAENFDYLLLQSVNGPAQYLVNNENSAIYVNKQSNDSADLQNKIKEILAFTFPEKQNKPLPDGTAAKQLIANKELWKFSQDSTNSLKIDEPELYIHETENYFIVTSKEQLTDNTTKTQSLKQLAKDCHINYSNQIVYSKIMNVNSINEILISNRNKNHISICIN
jgi:hypothetical protein